MGDFAAMPYKNHFWFHKETFSQQFLKEPYFIFCVKNVLIN